MIEIFRQRKNTINRTSHFLMVEFIEKPVFTPYEYRIFRTNVGHWGYSFVQDYRLLDELDFTLKCE